MQILQNVFSNFIILKRKKLFFKEFRRGLFFIEYKVDKAQSPK